MSLLLWKLEEIKADPMVPLPASASCCKYPLRGKGQKGLDHLLLGVATNNPSFWIKMVWICEEFLQFLSNTVEDWGTKEIFGHPPSVLHQTWSHSAFRLRMLSRSTGFQTLGTARRAWDTRKWLEVSKFMENMDKIEIETCFVKQGWHIISEELVSFTRCKTCSVGLAQSSWTDITNWGIPYIYINLVEVNRSGCASDPCIPWSNWTDIFQQLYRAYNL